MWDENAISRMSHRKARVGDQMLYEIQHSGGMMAYVHDQLLEMSFDEAVLRASNGERLWESWI